MINNKTIKPSVKPRSGRFMPLRYVLKSKFKFLMYNNEELRLCVLNTMNEKSNMRNVNKI